MTRQLNRHIDQPRCRAALNAWSVASKILLCWAIVILWLGNWGWAQNVSWPNSQPYRGSVDLHQTHLEPISPYALTRIQAARQRAEQFRTIARSASPVAARIASENAVFVDQWANLAESYVALADRVSDATAKLSTTTRDLEDVRSKLERFGLTPTVGLLLRHKKDQLETWRIADSDSPYATEELTRSRQEQLEIEIIRHDGSDAVRQSAEVLDEAHIDSDAYRNSALRSQTQSLLEERNRWLGVLRQSYQDYQHQLGQLDAATAASAKLTAEYRKLISRHITWIRSGDPLSLADVRGLKKAVPAMLDSRRSAEFGHSLKRKWNADSVGVVGLLACILLIVLTRWLAKSWLIGIGTKRRMREMSADSRKLVAGILSNLVALAFPIILYAIARWLGSGFVTESTLHASSGFYAASLVALAVEMPRQLLRNNGYLERHVNIVIPRRQRAAAYLTVVGFGLVLAAHVVTLAGLVDHGMWRDSAARLGFIAANLLVAWTMHLALRPSGGLLEPLIAKFGGSVIHRIRFVIYVAGIGFPLAMMALSALGYGFTANVLIVRAIVTLVSLLIAATLWAGVKILSARGWELLTGASARSAHDEPGEVSSEGAMGVQVSGVLNEQFLELKHQLAFLCQCALVVAVVVCLGRLWIDVFPSVRLGNPVVWTVQETVGQSAIDAAGQSAVRSEVATRSVTAVHLLLAAATLFVAFQLAKLLPALFDALVLQRVSFDEGMEHFALVTGRCLLFGVGCIIACKWIGVRWQAIQWLVVGLTIGLGFGLQDLVRNLLGGLVVLFEKPARLGDLITVGRVTGRVASQKFRTTVLSDDDGRELIVPNKNFVNEEVVNWRGAGRLNVIPIEVAVNRDERSVDICRTLQELVIAQPDVLLTPAPQATLVCVGKSSQRIEVRVWIEDGQDAACFRDSLLHVVIKYLRENELLAATQPTQPPMRDSSEIDLSRSNRTRTDRPRRRSA